MSLLLLSTAALACGGVFCDPQPDPNVSRPVVVQTGEEIHFAVRDDGVVEMEVSIFYDGPPEDFGWVMPVPTQPVIEVGEVDFLALREATSPVYTLDFQRDGDCQPPRIRLGCADFGLSALDDVGFDSGDTGVEVVAEAEIGPYETVTLQASSAQALVTWLEDQAFAIPGNFDEAVAPYVAEDQYFIALKLRGEFGVDRIEPVRLTYAGERASIPLRLTAVAAAEDMLIDVYFEGPARAVPDNYLHVEVNDAALGWLGEPGSDRLDAIGRAVDEAGGQAFVTTAAVDRAGGTLTRLTTLISPGEMTADPVFVFNADIPQRVRPNKTATLLTRCGEFEDSSAGERQLILPDGREIKLPSEDTRRRKGFDDQEIIDRFAEPVALLIEDYSDSGEPEVLFDYREDAALEARRFNRPGCGCTADGRVLSLFSLGLLVPLVFARRRT